MNKGFIVFCLVMMGCKSSGNKPLDQLQDHRVSPKNVVMKDQKNKVKKKHSIRPFHRSKHKAKIKHGVDKYLQDKELYRGGYIGNIGSKKVFYADRQLIPDYDRLYWVMVGVLSEKFGCFMERRITKSHEVLFKCRDGRFINFYRRQSKRWMLFGARQYDRFGREIVVKDQKIIGIGQRIHIPKEIWTNS